MGPREVKWKISSAARLASIMSSLVSRDAAADLREQVTREQGAGGLVEPQAALPVVRDVGVGTKRSR